MWQWVLHDFQVTSQSYRRLPVSIQVSRSRQTSLNSLCVRLWPSVVWQRSHDAAIFTDRFSILLALLSLDLDLPQHWKVTTKWPSSNFKWLHWYHILSAVWTTVIAVGCQCTPRLRPRSQRRAVAVAFCGGQDDPRRDDAQNGNVEENSWPWYRWPIEIDGLPINSMMIVHGKLLNNQRVYTQYYIIIHIFIDYLQHKLSCIQISRLCICTVCVCASICASIHITITIIYIYIYYIICAQRYMYRYYIIRDRESSWVKKITRLLQPHWMVLNSG